MRALLSPESRLIAGVKTCACTESAFQTLAQNIGIKLHRPVWYEVIKGTQDLKPELADHLLELLDEMRQLHAAVPNNLPIAWDRTDRIVVALVCQRLANVDRENRQFAVMAENAINNLS